MVVADARDLAQGGLKAGICMTQQLRNLDKRTGEAFLLVAAPLKIREGTGCPVRAFALVK
jgi:kynurenine formamidase